MSSRPVDPSSAPFPTTHWSRVAEAGGPASPEAHEALAAFYGAYYYPLYAFIRRKGHPPDEAGDLTQDYFVRLLEEGVLAAADARKGRLRALLLADCGHFLANRRDRAAARRRGGGLAIASIDARDAEGRYLREPAHGLTPERLFERAWALALLDRVLAELRREYDDAGKVGVFDRLKFALTGDRHSTPYAEIAGGLGTTEGAVQVAVHRLRRRYRDLLRRQIAATVGDEADVEDEVRALFAALGS